MYVGVGLRHSPRGVSVSRLDVQRQQATGRDTAVLDTSVSLTMTSAEGTISKNQWVLDLAGPCSIAVYAVRCYFGNRAQHLIGTALGSFLGTGWDGRIPVFRSRGSDHMLRTSGMRS